LIFCDFEFKRENYLLKVKFQSEKNIGLSGNSGAGKTTILNLISGILKPSNGKIILNNKEIFNSESKINIPIYQRKIAYVFQKDNLFPHLNILDNLKFGYKILKEDKKKFSLSEIIEYFKISDILHKYPKNISGGESQRVSIASAILTSPELILFDEPLNSLDESIKINILEYIKDSFKNFNIPIIYVSHNENEIEYLCDYFIKIEKTQKDDLTVSQII